jgi:hypothetical protein
MVIKMSNQEIWNQKIEYVRQQDYIPAYILQTTVDLMEGMKIGNHIPPDGVYPLMSETIMLEWQYGGFIRRLEIEDIGRGEMMITHPDFKTTFEDWKWNGQHLDLPGL